MILSLIALTVTAMKFGKQNNKSGGMKKQEVISFLQQLDADHADRKNVKEKSRKGLMQVTKLKTPDKTLVSDTRSDRSRAPQLVC